MGDSTRGADSIRKWRAVLFEEGTVLPAQHERSGFFFSASIMVSYYVARLRRYFGRTAGSLRGAPSR